MEILSIEFSNKENDMIRIHTKDGKILHSTYPCHTYHNQLIEEWKNKGFDILPYKTPKPSWYEIKIERNRRLRESDWTQLPDVKLSEKDMKAWLKYRENLRKINRIYYDNNNNIYFPTEPN